MSLLILALVIVGPSCKRARDEPKVLMKEEVQIPAETKESEDTNISAEEEKVIVEAKGK